MGSTATPATDRFTRDQRLLVLGVCTASGAAYLLPATYNYVVNPIVVTFGVDDTESSLIRQVPNIASLLVIFVAGVIGARLGDRRVMVIGGGLLFAGNALAALAPAFPVLVLGLAVQAVGSTALVVVSLSILGARIHDNASRAKAFAAFSMVSPAVFVVLPVLAGVLLEVGSWRAVVAVWALGGLAAALAALRLVPADAPTRSRSELLTPLLAGVVCMALVQAISHADADGVLSAASLVRVGIAVVALAGLVVAYRMSPAPSLSLAALRKGGMVVLLIVVALWCFTQLWYYMTIAYEYIYGLDALWTALAMVPAQLCAIVGAQVAGWMVRRMGLTASGVALLVGVGVSLILAVALSVDSPLWLAVAVTGLYSFTSVGAGVPMTKAIMDSAPPEEEGSASAFRAAAINVGTAIGIALVSGLVFSTFAAALTTGVAGAGLPPDEATQIAADLRDGADSEQESAVYSVPVSEVDEVDDLQKQALMSGIDAQNWFGAGISFVTAAAFALARRRQARSAPRPARGMLGL